MNKLARFVHISDTHIGITKDFIKRGVNSYIPAVKLVKTINSLPVAPDFVVHTGDVTAVNGEPEAYEIVKEVFSKLKYPIYYVTGNHDRSEPLMTSQTMGQKEPLTEDNTSNSCFFDLNGIRFLTIDGRGPDEIDPHGVVSDKQLKALEKQIADAGKPLAIFIHFPALPLDSTWLDRDMLLTNGQEFHQILTKGKDKIRGVFFGHVHRGMTQYQDGILYSSVASTFLQFTVWPGQEKSGYDKPPVGFYNYVTITPDSTLVKEHTFLI